MTTWTRYTKEEHGDWNTLLLELPGSSFFQTYEWGEVKRAGGWRILRMVALRADKVVAMTQVTFRPQPLGGVLAWIPGGIAGELAVWAASFKKALKGELGCKWLYVRLNALGHAESDDLSAQLYAGGWHRPSTRMGSGMSLSYNPARSEVDRVATTSGNWRHNLKRSGKYNLTFERWLTPQIEEILAVYRSMETLKGLPQQVSAEELSAILSQLQEDRLLFYRGIDSEGNTIALRACGIWGKQAIDLLAAASPVARKQYASHGTLWALMNDCSARGITAYDMGGADLNNKGVVDFKRGIGAELFTYLGEWEFACPQVMRIAANAMLKLKGAGGT